MIADNTQFGIRANILFSGIPTPFQGSKGFKVFGFKNNNDIIAVQPNHRVLEDTIKRSIFNYLSLDKSDAAAGYDKKANRYISKGTKKMDLKRSFFGSESPIYPNAISTTSYRAHFTMASAGPPVFLDALKTLWKPEEVNSLEALESLGKTTIYEISETINTMEFAGISVTSHCDQTWLKKGKKHISFDDLDIQAAQFYK